MAMTVDLVFATLCVASCCGMLSFLLSRQCPDTIYVFLSRCSFRAWVFINHFHEEQMSKELDLRHEAEVMMGGTQTFNMEVLPSIVSGLQIERSHTATRGDDAFCSRLGRS
jgi:hypothetical protein